MIATRLQSTELQVSGDQFPGTSSAQVRIYASDGLRTSQATSANFKIEDKGPSVIISLPLDGSSVPPNIPVMLTGSAFDWEDGMLPGDAFTWSSRPGGDPGHREPDLGRPPPGLAHDHADGARQRWDDRQQLYRCLLGL